jgi:hypothetical protein
LSEKTPVTQVFITEEQRPAVGPEVWLKAAVTVTFELKIIVHAPMPEQELWAGLADQPEKTELALGVAAKVITAPRVKVWEQAPPQLIEPPLTAPAPLPDLATVKVALGIALEQKAVEPPSVPWQAQRYWVAVSVVSAKEPAEQELREEEQTPGTETGGRLKPAAASR